MPVILGLLVPALFLSGCQSSQTEDEAQPTEQEWSPPPESEWVPLFEGENLDNWEFRSDAAEDVWHVQNGVIDCTPRALPQDADKHLWTSQEFEDFQLRVEWRIKETKGGAYEMPSINPDGTYETNEEGERITVQRQNADSGIYLRGTPKAQLNIWNWPVGSGEVYGYRTDESMPDEVRSAVTPDARADRPLGEWNTFVITMKGEELTVVLNGERVIEDARLQGIPEKGALTLQHHGGYNEETDSWSAASSLVEFRNIYIREL